MSSSVFFKFKSQKEPTRVEFDGTGISVFELKREIITKSGLGDGTDFDLAIYTDDGSEEYDDDTTIIPRSTTVVARRLPPMRPGAGRAARYISGKMPVNARFRKDGQKPGASGKPASSVAPPVMEISEDMTEEEKMKAMFAAQSAQWSVQKEEMAHQQPVYVKPLGKRAVNVPDHEPPNGYVCYRCSEKGHWIQQCPTNDDPEFDNRPRVKRTTGIPRSFLTTVDKSVALAKAGEDEEGKRPAGVMVNADGDYVIARPDKASWERYQAKAKTSAEASKLETSGNKDLQERGFECSIDKKLFVEPTKTPCCGKTFCNDCITNALMFSDFVCPACNTDNVLIDDLTPDEEVATKIKEYLEMKAREPSAAPESPKSDAVSAPVSDDASATANTTVTEDSTGGKSPEARSDETDTKAQDTTKDSNDTKKTPEENQTPTEADNAATTEGSNKRKRSVDDDVSENPRIPKAPRAMQMQQQRQAMNMANMGNMGNMFPMGMPMMPPFMMPNGMPMAPNMMGMMGMGMPMMPGMGMGGMPGMPFPGAMPNLGNNNRGQNWNNNRGSFNNNGQRFNNNGNWNNGHRNNYGNNNMNPGMMNGMNNANNMNGRR